MINDETTTHEKQGTVGVQVEPIVSLHNTNYHVYMPIILLHDAQYTLLILIHNSGFVCYRWQLIYTIQNIRFLYLKIGIY
jgi:hypothetical protein